MQGMRKRNRVGCIRCWLAAYNKIINKGKSQYSIILSYNGLPRN
jgi:hypothetical protein